MYLNFFILPENLDECGSNLAIAGKADFWHIFGPSLAFTYGRNILTTPEANFYPVHLVQM